MSVLAGVAPAQNAFVPRHLYGAYIRDLLLDARCGAAADRLILQRDGVVAIEDDGSRLTFVFSPEAACVLTPRSWQAAIFLHRQLYPTMPRSAGRSDGSPILGRMMHCADWIPLRRCC